MRHDVNDTFCFEDGEHPTAPLSTPAERSSPSSARREAAYSTLSPAALGAECLRELGTYRRGEPCNETYGLELLRRATVHGDPESWAWVHHCLSEMVRGWLHRHPGKEAACNLDSEENFVTQAFEHFWQATTLSQTVEFSRLAAALQYLRASLNGAILDTIRTYSRPREVSLLESGEPQGEDHTDSTEVWDILQTMLPNRHEQRLAYLLFHCGLKPREIIRFCPQEFRDVHEIYCLRRNIMERLLRNEHQLPWRLTPVE